MKTTNPCKGEIWLVDFNPTRGSEMTKCRPAVVISEDCIGKLPLKIVVPVTDWNTRYDTFPWFTKLTVTPKNGLRKISGADGFQVKSVSIDRFRKKMGLVTHDEFDIILNTIALCIGL